MNSLTPRLDRQSKSQCINGSCEYFQRGAALPAPTPITLPTGGKDYSSIDRFLLEYQGLWNVAPTSEQSNTSPSSLSNVRRSILFSGDPQDATAKLVMAQRVESIIAVEDSIPSNKLSIALSVYSESATTVRCRILTADAEDDHSTQTEIYNQTLTITKGSWEDISFLSIPMSAMSANGYEIEMTLEDMDEFGAVKTHKITGLRAWKSVNDNVREFSGRGRDFTEELQLCQRYYEKNQVEGQPLTNTFTDNTRAETQVFISANDGIKYGNKTAYAASKRTLAIVTLMGFNSGGVGLVHRQYYNAGGIDVVAILFKNHEDGFAVRETANSVGYGKYTFNWTADAEL